MMINVNFQLDSIKNYLRHGSLGMTVVLILTINLYGKIHLNCALSHSLSKGFGIVSNGESLLNTTLQAFVLLFMNKDAL